MYQIDPKQRTVNGCKFTEPGRYVVTAMRPIHPYQMVKMDNLPELDARMIYRFLNRLHDLRSILAISRRMEGVGNRDLAQLLKAQPPQTEDGPALAPDYLKLSIQDGEIVWADGSLLESFERGPTPLYEVRPMHGWRNGLPYDLPGRFVVRVISLEHFLVPGQLRSITNLSASEAEMVAAFVNRLCNVDSLRAIQRRMGRQRETEEGGLNRLLNPPVREISLLAGDSSVRRLDYLNLSVVDGAIVWEPKSILEKFESEYRPTIPGQSQRLLVHLARYGYEMLMDSSGLVEQVDEWERDYADVVAPPLAPQETRAWVASYAQQHFPGWEVTDIEICQGPPPAEPIPF